MKDKVLSRPFGYQQRNPLGLIMLNLSGLSYFTYEDLRVSVYVALSFHFRSSYHRYIRKTSCFL